MQGLKYTVIDKSEIPKREENGRLYGEWKALARFMAILPPSKAVVLPVDYDKYASCIRRAGIEEGIKVSTSFINGRMYVVRVGRSDSPKKFKHKVYSFVCSECREVFDTKYKNQTHCDKAACKRARRIKAMRAYRNRKRETQKAVDNTAPQG